MSTVPKLTYAKIGKGPKAKVESVSSQLSRNKGEKSDDLFSHLNQENLKYIQKQLKLKKNRSDQEQTTTNPLDFKDAPLEAQQQLHQINKLYHKYRRNEEVIQRESHLQDTQRCSQVEKPYLMVFNEQGDDQDAPADKPIQQNRQVRFIQNHLNQAESKMYQSLPQGEGIKRMSSGQNYFGEAMSTNLNKQEGGQFIEFLQGYISDLNQSVLNKTKYVQDPSVDKPQFDQLRNSKPNLNSKSKPVPEKSHPGSQLKVDMKKLAKIKKSSDTFGEPNSRFTLRSQQVQNQTTFKQLQLQVKEEKLHNISLAKEIQRLRQLLLVKENIIKRLQIQNELFQEEVWHAQKKQEIINRNRKSSQNLRDFQNLNTNSRITKHINDENFQHRDAGNYHQRNASVNPQTAAVSYRSSFKVFEDFAELFENTSNLPQKDHRFRQKARKKQNGSLQRLQKEYGQFLESQRRSYRETRASRRAHQILH